MEPVGGPRRVARETGNTPSQVALAWTADQPSVAAPIVGARPLTHLTENLGAAELHLDTDTTAALNTVSAPQHGGYPYGVFGTAQRSRNFHGSKVQANLIDGGSDAPLGHA
ncbi:aldo/keto reductase [Streptomyces phaeochromogenes]|uniref:aldo/keto reductase n=1 Tax=Streptomyces phaeochromogenes TaxID=1923 RepID=UPI002DD8C5B7|nr:aldo/keto reductase [Streptomyces phaeochromogenes]WRZ28786.1 aldo/keto reductase [Streptomyces phaeochromogenes]